MTGWVAAVYPHVFRIGKLGPVLGNLAGPRDAVVVGLGV